MICVRYRHTASYRHERHSAGALQHDGVGFGAAAGGLLGGLLLERIGGRGMYVVIGLAMLFCTAIIMLVERRLPAERPATSTLPNTP